MSDKPIGVGDLVMMVVNGHACASAALGIPFRVTGIVVTSLVCSRCHYREIYPKTKLAEGYRKYSIPVSWLIRIDPPAIPETTEREEEICAH